MQGGPGVLVLTETTKRDTGRKAQLGNIKAAKAVADIIRTCLGPKAMLKMMLDPVGGITITNDGNAILREIDVVHPAAKSMIELSKTQDEEVGDGTTSVIILAGELLAVAQPHVERGIHPTVIIKAYFRALETIIGGLSELSAGNVVDIYNRAEMLKIIQTCIGTKFVKAWSNIMCSLAIDAVQTVVVESVSGEKEIDIKRYVRVERISGGDIEDSEVIHGVILNKDVLHSKMRRRIENPRIILLDCPLEPQKLENAASLEVNNAADWAKILQQEEQHVQNLCNAVIKFKPDLVVTEKGLSDLAQHFFLKANITCLRRLKKTDNNRLSRCTGATIVNRVEIQESDVGTRAGLFEVRKIGDEYYSYITDCKDPKACTILLRGASRDVLKEVERNLDDAMAVVRNIIINPLLVPGGGGAEMELAARLRRATVDTGIGEEIFRDVATALEVIPRTLVENGGGRSGKIMSELRAKHAERGGENWGVDGLAGGIRDMREAGVMDPVSVKSQTIKTAIEAACLLLRVDDIVSGIKTKKQA